MRLSLVPRTTEFYDLFALAGENALKAARHAETRFRALPTLREWATNSPALAPPVAESRRADLILGEVRGLAA